jgi:pyruvate formate-lyase activating enzyme-like uncharacterized protein
VISFLPRWSYGYVALLVIAPTLLAMYFRDIHEARENGKQEGRNEMMALAYSVERAAAKQMLAAERKADAAVTQTRHAEREAQQANERARAAAQRTRSAFANVTVGDTVTVEIVRESATLLAQVDTLTARVDSLVMTVQTERAANAAVILTYKQADDAQRIAFASVNARLAKAERRPTRTTQVVTALGTGVAVALTCKAVPQC